VGVPRYLATATADDLEHTLWLADGLSARPDTFGSVALVQCGRSSAVATDLAKLLGKSGRHPVLLTVCDRTRESS
jgi:hypothetical protein